GFYTDGSTQDLTTSAVFDSSNEGVASISNAGGSQGLATGLAGGQSTISAMVGAVSGSTTLTVTNAALVSIAVTPTNPSAASGTTPPFKATGVFSDSSTQDLTASVTWGSSVSSVASISNAGGSAGLATGQAPGQTTISATSGGITGSTTLKVTPATLVSI